MHCPYCQSPVCEESPACPRCGLDMDKAGAFFGTAPPLVQGVSDTSGVLTNGDKRAIRRAILEFERRFPQAGFTAAFMALPKDTPGPTYAWWVFNRTNPAGELLQASDNRHLFLLVDTAARGAWLTGGYGLEPFLSARHFQQCLTKARPHFANGQWAAGIAALLNEAEAVFRFVITSLPRVFGLAPASSAAKPATAW